MGHPPKASQSQVAPLIEKSNIMVRTSSPMEIPLVNGMHDEGLVDVAVCLEELPSIQIGAPLSLGTDHPMEDDSRSSQ